MSNKIKMEDTSTQKLVGSCLNIKPKSRTDKSFCVSSKTQEGLHVLFWDFDNIEKYYMLRSLSQIQSYHKLGKIYIAKSKHGFNAFCLDKLWLNEAYNILFYTRWNDFNHVRIGFLNESWALRLSEDKTLMYVLDVTNEWQNRNQSNGHYLFFKKFYNNRVTVENPDDGDDVQLESYKQNKIQY